ncbi:hypothetical protein HDV05_003224 [Chytridiales sp. JEL 0842]|nr:hypothetical protein HDV05_003224 [Chytridiales sp. JEL 0842]
MQNLKEQITTSFHISSETDFTLKYKDPEGLLTTIFTDTDLREILSDLPTTSTPTLKLFIFLDNLAGADVAAVAAEPSIAGLEEGMGGMDLKSSSMSSFTDSMFDSEDVQETSKSDVFEILRDISLYITSKDLTPINSWVSSEKSFISPAAFTASKPELNTESSTRFSKKIVTKTQQQKEHSSCSNPSKAEVLGGVPEDWSVDKVVAWLHDWGFDDFVPYFKEQEVTGKVLLHLKHENLKKMGIRSTGRRIKFFQMVSELKT